MQRPMLWCWGKVENSMIMTMRVSKLAEKKVAI